MKIKSPFLVRLLRQQFIYIALAAVVGGIVWANRLNINPIAVIVYTLTIANLMTIPLESLRFLYWEEPFPRNWVIYMGLMKTMAAGEFKARCLRVMDGVQSTREAVVITKNGKPVAKLVPADEPSDEVFGCLAGEIEILGDIESPILPAEDWDMRAELTESTPNVFKNVTLNEHAANVFEFEMIFHNPTNTRER